MFIYIITNDVNDKSYIGACANLSQRWSVHRNHALSKKGKCRILHAAMREYGINKFHITSIWSGHVGPTSLSTLERYYIRSLRTKFPEGYNLTEGGRGMGINPCDETLLLMSKATRERTAIKGGPNKGKKFSSAHKLNISLSNKAFAADHPDIFRDKIKKMNEVMTSKQRSDAGKKGALARWGNKRVRP